ncbi:extracellular solute-binding protein [candidate division GN15 bacterium]|nr:extracellular solute-binding protein [candidate division GN15 bacterium]
MKRVLILAIVVLLAGATVSAETTLEWWQFWTDPAVKPVIDSIVTEFESAHPDINVNVTDLTWSNGHEKIVIGFASGRGPDVVELGSDWIAQFAASGQIADLTDDLGADTAGFQGWDMATYEGAIYARPWILGTRVVFLNRDHLTLAGFDTTWLPVSFAQFYDAIHRIDSAGRSQGIYGWGSNTAEKHRLYKKFLPFFWSYGAQIFTDDREYCVLSSLMAVEALKQYKKLHDLYGYVDSQRGIEDAFLNGNVGVILSGDWLLKRIELEDRDINLASTLFPGPQYPGRSFKGGEFLAISEMSDHREEALTFIEFVTSPENQLRFCKANRSANPSSLTAQQDAYFQDNIHLQTFIKQIQFAKHPPVDPDWVYIEDEIEQAVEDALFGDGLPATALLKAQQQISEIMEQ